MTIIVFLHLMLMFLFLLFDLKLMVVDLQGVFETYDDGTSRYVLTDPVIHKRKHGKQKQLTSWTFGRTDRGEKGMKAFFETHECNEVCRLLGLHEKG